MIKLENITLKELLEIAGGDEQLLRELFDKFRQWLQQQFHLPQKISDNQLQSLILTSKFDLEKAKKRLDSLCTLRTLLPEFFANYDPLCDDIARFLKNIYTFMLLDLHMEEDKVNSILGIIDCDNFTFDHMIKYTPSLLKQFFLCLEAYGVKVKAIYILNAPTYINQLLVLAKMFMKPKLYKRIHISPGIEFLSDDVPRSILPKDYGGEEPSLEILTDMWHTELIERRDWLLEHEKLKTNESLRTEGAINADDLFGVAGTFRKLDID